MLNKLPQLQTTIVPDCASPLKAVDYINSYIDKTSCENISVDISFMNVLDACYVSTMCSTNHFTKYPNGRITWKISSNLIKEFNENMELGNSNYVL